MARSALFSCVQGKDRRVCKDTLLASQDGVEIRFTGEQLNQDDHDLMMLLTTMAQHKPLGEPVTVSAYAILKALGRKTGKSQYVQLRSDFLRLFAATVSLRDTHRKVEYFGHLIDEAAQDENSRHWVFKFNPKMRQFFEPNTFTLIQWKERLRLKGKDLARWLQLYLASHAKPFPVKVETLRRLSGSKATALKRFRQTLRYALDDLEANGDIKAWDIDEDDLVHVDRGVSVTASQGRHLVGDMTHPTRLGRSLRNVGIIDTRH